MPRDLRKDLDLVRSSGFYHSVGGLCKIAEHALERALELKEELGRCANTFSGLMEALHEERRKVVEYEIFRKNVESVGRQVLQCLKEINAHRGQGLGVAVFDGSVPCEDIDPFDFDIIVIEEPKSREAEEELQKLLDAIDQVPGQKVTECLEGADYIPPLALGGSD